MDGVGGIVGWSRRACLLLSLVCVSFCRFQTRCLLPFSSLLSFFPPTLRRLIKIVFTMKHFRTASLLALVISAAHTAGAVDPVVVIVSERIRCRYSQRLLRSTLFKLDVVLTRSFANPRHRDCRRPGSVLPGQALRRHRRRSRRRRGAPPRRRRPRPPRGHRSRQRQPGR